ncbi:REP element-mobilizing transposase RayT [Halanaerobium saccharolyticum]|uniref:REP element-mobilizing transposase RayT n=1 Tax=Halanaerobium saccharolyticum TaxID=43595 RepID=A0A4R6LRR5_9FIRM|nr:transposase [Halanaerobium saccharolyticum]TDO91284.1 REP element-mobilizing transposase RayT [Halanaerobium saccharolyticum]
MTYKRRKWYPGAKYHITCRGNRKNNIFLDKVDYKIYLSILREVKRAKPFKILTYCLMPNHVHLQLKTEVTAIWTIMHGINWRYSKYFNERHDTVGHLFQGRYASKLIENNYYNLTVSRYIHLNPVKDKLVISPTKYKWSSYAGYMGVQKNNLIDENEILSYFGGRREFYNRYVLFGKNCGSK